MLKLEAGKWYKDARGSVIKVKARDPADDSYAIFPFIGESPGAALYTAEGKYVSYKSPLQVYNLVEEVNEPNITS